LTPLLLLYVHCMYVALKNCCDIHEIINYAFLVIRMAPCFAMTYLLLAGCK